MNSTHLIISLLLLLVTVSAASVSYTHASGVGEADQDCFDETNKTCITRDIKGPPYNAGSDGKNSISWGCGTCDSSPEKFSKLDSTFRDECLGGFMPGIVGTNLCLQTESNGKWDLVFKSFEQKGGGGFSYKRTEYIQAPKRLPQKLLRSSRPYYQRYAKDCGIEYTNKLPPQNLRALCREHRANLLALELNSTIEVEL